MSNNTRDCNYCKTELVRFRKDENGNWHRFEDFDCKIEHTYKRCKAVQDAKKNYVAPVPEGQSRIAIQEQKTTPVVTQQQQPAISITSVYSKITFLEGQIKELKKMIETQSSIIDGMAQNITLLVQNNYPKPEPVMSKCNRCDKLTDKHDLNRVGICPNCMDESNKLAELDKNLEEAKSSFAPESKIEEKIVEPQNVVESNSSAFVETQTKIKDELFKDKGWTEISELFECDSCRSSKHNGWTKAGTKCCEECLEDILKPKQHLRTIEEVNMMDDDISF
jgi:hypothetical protein